MVIGRKMMTMINTSRSNGNGRRFVPEALYPREGFVMIDGFYVPIFLGHPHATCDECEFPFGNKSRHPKSPDVAGTVVICGGHRMRLITGNS